MLQFVFLAVLISVPVSNLSMELSRFPFKNLQDARLGSFEEVCNWFCQDAHDYFFRTLDDVINPRIFCGLCQKKLSTASTVSPSTATSTTTPSSITTKMAPSTTASTAPSTTASTAPSTTASTAPSTTASTAPSTTASTAPSTPSTMTP